MSTGKLCRSILLACALLFSGAAFSQNVHISEIHYDNAGTDTGEALEISAPAGADLTGWQVVLYNATNGAPYDTRTLNGTVPATCGAQGVVTLDYPVNGIQNGSPDGVALVNSAGTLVEFLSYEGVFAGASGPASGVTSTDIGVSEQGTEAPGLSLARNASGVWSGPAASTFGACNDAEPPPPAMAVRVTVTPSPATVAVGRTVALTAIAFDENDAPIPGAPITWMSLNDGIASVSPTGVVTGNAPGGILIFATADSGVRAVAVVSVTDAPPPVTDVHVNEVHYDNVGTDSGEAIEIEGPAGADVSGFQLVLYNGDGGAPYNTVTLSGVLPASCGTRGVLVTNYPANGIQNGSPDGVALVSSTGVVLEFLSYEGVLTATSGPAAGMTSVDIGASESTSTPVGNSLQRNSAGTWMLSGQSFGACNPDVAIPVGNSLSFSGRNSSEPALPAGFEDQLFATLRDVNGTTVPAVITWSSDTPDVASIDSNGVVHALAAGTAVLRATADDGTTATWSLPTRIAAAGTTAAYGNNTEFGEPSDADPSDDFVVHYEQYTASYNPNRGSPNWVAYEFDASHFGAEDRCECFTADPSLPSTFAHITTNDYTGAGAAAGYGIDRGHLARSFDRTSGSLDNARTFLFDNIVPQASDLNQGPWAALENDLGDLARVQDKEVYVIAGAFGNKGTVKNEGKIVIPTYTWKVALILPRDKGLADIHDYRDVEAIAVLMPNEPGIRNVPWQTYETTIDNIEALSGYDLLAALPDKVEAAVESNTQPPLATASGPAASIAEGGSATFSAAGSIDPNGSIVSYAWDFGDGTTGSGDTVSHVYVQDGVYSVRLTVTDNDGLTDTATVSVTVTNVAPVVNAVPNATVDLGAAYTVSGTFTDPGADTWTATVDWGDGSTPSTQSTASRSFSLSHTYTRADLYTVTVTVADGRASGSTSSSVTVAQTQTTPQLGDAITLIDKLVADRKISRALGALLKFDVEAVRKLIARGNNRGAMTVLHCTVSELDFLVRIRAVKAADVAPLRALLIAVAQSLR